MNNYQQISIALKWAERYNASNVTIELNEGELTDTPARIFEIFDNLEIGESFELVSINFN
jgi:hypothetical protein